MIDGGSDSVSALSSQQTTTQHSQQTTTYNAQQTTTHNAQQTCPDLTSCPSLESCSGVRGMLVQRVTICDKVFFLLFKYSFNIMFLN